MASQEASHNKHSNDPNNVKKTTPRSQPCLSCQRREDLQDDCFNEQVSRLQRLVSALEAKESRLEQLLSDWEKRFERLKSALEQLVNKTEEKPVGNSCPRSLSHSANYLSSSSSLKLRFLGNFPEEYLTGESIKTDIASLKVELRAASGSRSVSSLGSSVKVKIFVLNGDFDVEEGDSWTSEAIDANIVKPRPGKAAELLKGRCEMVMEEGIATFDDITFTDNSKAMRNGKFRLGARVVKNLPQGVVIMDAVSPAFQVKERRGKSYKRQKTLDNGTECLKNIGNTLKAKLAAEGINSVQDFLQLCHTDLEKLQDILHLPDNKLSELIKDAKSYPTTKEEDYREHFDIASGVTLHLDCVFNIKGAMFADKGIYKLPEDLSISEKKLVEKIRRDAYQKRNELGSSSGIPGASGPTTIKSSVNPTIGNQQTYQDAMTADMGRSSIPTFVANPTVSMEKEGQEISNTPQNQAYHHGEGLFHQYSPGHNAEVGNMISKTLLGLPEVQVTPADNLYYPYPNAAHVLLSGLNAYTDDFHRSMLVNNNAQGFPDSGNVPLHSMIGGFESSHCQVEDYSQPFDTGPAKNSLKRQSCG